MNEIKKKIYTDAFLLLAAVFSLFYVNYFYLTKNIEGSSASIIEKKKSVEKLTMQNSQIKSIRTKTEELQNNINKTSEYIVDYSSISDFVTEIKDTARKNNIELDMKVSDKEKTEVVDGLSYINYNVKAAGRFSEMIQFLIYLENSKYYTNMEKIKISSNYAKDADSDNKIILDSVLKVYVWN